MVLMLIRYLYEGFMRRLSELFAEYWLSNVALRLAVIAFVVLFWLLVIWSVL